MPLPYASLARVGVGAHVALPQSSRWRIVVFTGQLDSQCELGALPRQGRQQGLHVLGWDSTSC